MDVGLLQLLQLADSALPIGTLAHSFGFETLAAEDTLRVDCLAEALDTYLEESLLMEATFCRAAYGTAVTAASLRDLNGLLSARKPAREMRDASLTLGRRFLAILRVCTGEEHWEKVGLCHLSIAFGLACRQLGINEDFCILAFLEQSCATVLSAVVRLMPLGQLSASVLLWELKPKIAEVCRRSRDFNPRQVPSFNLALEIASMRHPLLETRLFIS